MPTALAAPVEDGMMLACAPRPPRQSLEEGPSTVFCVAVVACTVVISPSTNPNSSSIACNHPDREHVSGGGGYTAGVFERLNRGAYRLHNRLQGLRWIT
jgi:hypothetical protein